ncbi:hypothetical protein TNIN_236641 [Trichonephila inaurata madagascariensis]|uniref:Uncharacterized protein n=1 Tax=Trichonephila inaurata madagascariensis TaxID=2747483 RepID=A0A8X7BNZ2_9ARAC|nr:hypothetical protein TNIN_236641 [Trichonephila inaurata madagascariensis]
MVHLAVTVKLRSVFPPVILRHVRDVEIGSVDSDCNGSFGGKTVNVSIDRLKPCFFDNSSESDIESSIREDTPNKPAEMPKKKIRFAPLPLPTSTRVTRGGRQVRLPVRYQ